MGWLGGHLHAFEAGGVIYEIPDDEGFGFRETVDERRARLNDVLPTVGAKMRWDYDFGDGWTHDVVVEAIEPPRSGTTYPVCVAGRRACPPDDCGGPWGYANLLAALRRLDAVPSTRSSPRGRCPASTPACSTSRRPAR